MIFIMILSNMAFLSAASPAKNQSNLLDYYFGRKIINTSEYN